MVSVKVFLFSALSFLVVGSNVPTGIRPPKKYVVNLDLPEEQRWTQIVLDHQEVVKDVHIVLRKYFPEELIPLVEAIAVDIDQYLHPPYAGEMRGIAKVLNASLGDIVFFNLLYDVTAYCTSIVSQDSSGQIWHSRNLDYGFTDMLKNITVAVDFQKGGKTVYNVVTFVGYIGVLTGQKPHGFTITVDERDQGNALLNLLVGLLDKSVVPVSFLVRDAIAKSPNYTAAVDLLAYTPTAAPVYVIIAGVKPVEGAVISKRRLGPDDIWAIDPANGRWFEVETNYDHWLPPPTTDDRRDPANKAMKAMGQSNISVQSLFNVMSTQPVLNNKTTYTIAMSAAKPELMQTWIRV